MNREQRILSTLLARRKSYNSVATFLNEEDFSRQGWVVVENIISYYETDTEATHVDLSILTDTLAVAYPKHIIIFKAILSDLEEVSGDNTVKEYLALKEEGIKHQLAEACLSEDGEENRIEELIAKLVSLRDTKENDDDGVFIGGDISCILDARNVENIIRIAPAILSDKLDGGVVPGTQMIVYAPTEGSKSLFAINASCALLREGKKVLYCGNEDPHIVMRERFLTNLTQMERAGLLIDRDKTLQTAIDNGFLNLIYKDMRPGNVGEIRRLIERYSPTLVVVDQMANMDCRNNNKVEKNEILAADLRSIAQKYDVVTLIVHQASEAAYGNLVLEKQDLYFSNVAVQGQMDVMIGIGQNESYMQENKIMIRLAKNKISSDHGWFPVRIDPLRSSIIE